jgi:response regulator NasT
LRRVDPDLTLIRHDPEFRADPTPSLVVDDGLVIRAANPALASATRSHAEEILERFLFEAFPASPDTPEAVPEVRAVLEEVLRRGEARTTVVQRFAVPDPLRDGEFVVKYWLPTYEPLCHDGRPVGVLIRADELVAPRPEVLDAVTRVREALLDRPDIDAETRRLMVDAVIWAIREYDGLEREIGHLRTALESRATIDQAKGILMVERRCTPEEAFEHLVRLSNDSNVRVAEVARAMVYQVGTGPTP